MSEPTEKKIPPLLDFVLLQCQIKWFVSFSTPNWNKLESFILECILFILQYSKKSEVPTIKMLYTSKENNCIIFNLFHFIPLSQTWQQILLIFYSICGTTALPHGTIRQLLYYIYNTAWRQSHENENVAVSNKIQSTKYWL
jgi:hypothetical protein